jgi:hypothetical protein
MKSRARYGIDAPGLFRVNIILAALLALAATVGLAWPRPNSIAIWFCGGAFIVAAFLLFLAMVMLWSSLVGKMRVRDRLVAALAFRTGMRARRGMRPRAGADRLRKKADRRAGRRRRSLGCEGPVEQ